MEAISEKIIKHFKYLGLYGAKAEEKIREVLESEYRRRLTRYEHTDRLLKKKYGMTFDEFERRELVKTKGFVWEVESDSDEWEMAVDGIESMKRGLEELLGERFDA
jgi:GMP synthase PP-ATPase subunit